MEVEYGRPPHRPGTEEILNIPSQNFYRNEKLILGISTNDPLLSTSRSQSFCRAKLSQLSILGDVRSKLSVVANPGPGKDLRPWLQADGRAGLSGRCLFCSVRGL